MASTKMTINPHTANRMDAKMNNFTTEDWKLIFNAVRYYQMQKVPLNGQAYQDCDRILNQIFPTLPLPEQSTPVPQNT